MATIMQSLAALANKTPLRRLQSICENQASIKTHVLNRYLEQIGDDMAKLAADLRTEFDGLVAAKTRRHHHDTKKPLGYIRQYSLDLILDADVDVLPVRAMVFPRPSEGSVPVYLHSDWADGQPSDEASLRAENERLRSLLLEYQSLEETHADVPIPTGKSVALIGDQPGGQASEVLPSLSKVTVQKDFFGTVHIMVGDFDMIQIQYDYRYIDNASQNRLAQSIAALLGQPADSGGQQ